MDERRGIKRKKLYKKKRIYKKVEQNKETHNNLFFRPSKSDSINVKIKTKKK